MAEKKVKLIIEEQKKQEPTEVKLIVERVWDFKEITDKELESVFEQLILERDIDTIMLFLSHELALTGMIEHLFWSEQIGKIIEKQAKDAQKK